ncbi:MAG: alpha/beta hydrolase [Flavobacteriaceae bacterium]|nr:alpha/beta hydrolase [Flavobacteriaceae bacterium]
MPGLAASPQIFEYLELPKDKYECHFLKWLIPISIEESISNYAQRLCMEIKEPNPILVGVSFGGIMVQEMASHINCNAVVIISSVKSEKEFPNRMGFAKNTGIYKLFPTKYLKSIKVFAKKNFGDSVKRKVALYEKYLAFSDARYLDWAFHNILHWKKNYKTSNLFHIHGEADGVFPVKYISNYISIKEGTHIMILNKAKEISRILCDMV